ncbi:MAG: hypothetical protein JSR66_17400 [Proteobacteria bacterium]|nr:hypothetical protein [Pseudomonadota bacterium]
MSARRRFGFGIALMVCLAGVAVAATPLSGVERLTTGLNLSADQQTRVRSILWKQHQRIERLWRDTALSAAERITATRQLNRQTTDLIRAVLTEQQRQLYNPPGPDPRSLVKDQRSVEDWIRAAEGAH